MFSRNLVVAEVESCESEGIFLIWLRLIRRYWTGTVVFLVVFTLSQVFRPPSESGITVNLIYSVRDLIASLFIGYGVSIWMLRNQIRVLLNGHERLPRCLRMALAPYSLGLISREVVRLDDLTSTSGLTISRARLRDVITGAFRQHRDGHWVMVQRITPSEFADTFPTYKDTHFDRIRLTVPGMDVRILLVSESDLQSDAAQASRKFQTFYDSNKLHHVRLLQVDPAEAAEDLANLLNSSAWLYGSDFVVNVRRSDRAPGEDSVVVSVRSLDDDLRLHLRETLRRLNAHARELRMSGRAGVRFDERSSKRVRLDEERMLWSLQ